MNFLDVPTPDTPVAESSPITYAIIIGSVVVLVAVILIVVLNTKKAKK